MTARAWDLCTVFARGRSTAASTVRSFSPTLIEVAMHSIHRCLSFAAIVAVAGACSDPVSGPVRRPQQNVASSAPVAGRVVFLPPLGAGNMPTGESDVSRAVALEICVRADTACVGDPIARIDTGGMGDSRLRVIGAAG